jgi:uncharacterized protein YegL
MTSFIKSVSSPSHPISFEFGDDPQHAHVKLANEDGTPLVKDFELAISLAKPHEYATKILILYFDLIYFRPCVRVAEENGYKIGMFSIFPDLNEDTTQIFTEMIFIVDRSGSMSGARINSVKETLQIFLRSLPEGTLFNIISFGTNFTKLFPESKEYNEASLKQASEMVSSMTANMGGTEILKPIRNVFEQPPKQGIPRQLFILTDGEVSNTQDCINTVKKNAQTTRVFTFGIGTDASKTLVMGMAKAGEGQYELITNNANMDEKVMRQLNRALKPALTDVSKKKKMVKNFFLMF